MPVTSFITDPQALTMTVTADFAAPPERVWDAYADARQLERFWGPPTFPATFTRHDFAPGGLSSYAMTGPEGDQHHGYWQFVSVDPPRSFEVIDGFANPDGTPNTELPTMRMRFEFASTPAGTRMRTVSRFDSIEDLEQVLAMGVEEGTREAMGQIDAVLADQTSFAPDQPASSELLSDTQVRISRVLDADAQEIWRAYHDPALLRRWMLGPDGWTMPVCEVSDEVGSTYRFEWEQADGSGRFGFTGTQLESVPPSRAVSTEQMIGMDGSGTLNELTVTPLSTGTLLTVVITYPDKELRDTVLATGMVGGMESSYARLESILAAP